MQKKRRSARRIRGPLEPLESGIPDPPSIQDFIHTARPPESTPSTHESSKILSRLSSATNHLFRSRKVENLSIQNTQPETHAEVFTYQSTSEQPVPYELTPPVTASSASPAISPTLTAEATPVVDGLRTCTHQKGTFYIQSTAQVPIEIQVKWEQEFNPRLIEEFRRLNLNCVSANLFVAGRQQDQLVPTIAILSTSIRDKKKIRKSLESSKLLTDITKADVRLEILVDAGLGTKGSSDTKASGSEYPIEGLMSGSLSSIYGILIRSAENSGVNLVCATLGGVVAINDTLYGLTAGHIFAQSYKDLLYQEDHEEPSNDEESQTSQATEDEVPMDGDIQSISDEESSIWSEPEVSLDPMTFLPPHSGRETGRGPTQAKHDNDTQSNDKTYRFLGSLDAVAWADDRYMPMHRMEGSIYASLYQFQKRPSCSDWALMNVDPGLIPSFEFHGSNHNEPAIPGMEENHHAETIASTDKLGSVQVEIFGGRSAFQVGMLNECKSSIFLQKNLFDVRQIILQNPLELGDSGAWVIHDRQVCGMIIAGGGTISFAYMLPIVSILQDIQSSLGVQVTIPSEAEIKRIISIQNSKSRPNPVSTKKVNRNHDTPEHLADPVYQTSTKTQLVNSTVVQNLDQGFSDGQPQTPQEKSILKRNTQDTKPFRLKFTASDIEHDLSNPRLLKVARWQNQSARLTVYSPTSLIALSSNISTTIITVEQLTNCSKSLSPQLRSATLNILIELGRSANWVNEYHGATIKAFGKDHLTYAFESIKLECDFISEKCRRLQQLGFPRVPGSGYFGTVHALASLRLWRILPDSGIATLMEHAARLKQTNDALSYLKQTGLHTPFEFQVLNQNPASFTQKHDPASPPDVLLLQCNNKIYPLNFPAFSLYDGLVQVGELRRLAAEAIGTESKDQIVLSYKGKILLNDAASCGEEGLKQYSRVECHLPERKSDDPNPAKSVRFSAPLNQPPDGLGLCIPSFLSGQTEVEQLPEQLEIFSESGQNLGKRAPGNS